MQQEQQTLERAKTPVLAKAQHAIESTSRDLKERWTFTEKPKKLALLWGLVQIAPVCYAICAVAVSTQRNSVAAFGFTAIWIAVEAAAFGVGGTLILRDPSLRSKLQNLGLLTGVSCGLALQMFTEAVVASGRVGHRCNNNQNCEVTTSERAVIFFAILSVVAYSTYAFVSTKFASWVADPTTDRPVVPLASPIPRFDSTDTPSLAGKTQREINFICDGFRGLFRKSGFPGDTAEEICQQVRTLEGTWTLEKLRRMCRGPEEFAAGLFTTCNISLTDPQVDNLEDSEFFEVYESQFTRGRGSF